MNFIKTKPFYIKDHYSLIARHENTKWSSRQSQAMSFGVSVTGYSLIIIKRTSQIFKKS